MLASGSKYFPRLNRRLGIGAEKPEIRNPNSETGTGTPGIGNRQLEVPPGGTAGAVAIDKHGNLAAATSSGGVAGRLGGRVGDTAIIGAGTEIVDSYIGPFTSIQKRCRIVGTEIEHSIVLEGSEILDIGSRIDQSLIGRDVRIHKCPPKPLAYRFMVGDKSEIGLK